jgi:hypothetical protein
MEGSIGTMTAGTKISLASAILVGIASAGAIENQIVQAHDAKVIGDALMEKRVEALEWVVFPHSMAEKYPATGASRGFVISGATSRP